MITLHATKKLLAKLPVDAAGYLCAGREAGKEKGTTESPLGAWHGNLLVLQRRNCILLVHDTTRFPVFMSCLTRPDFANLDRLFVDALVHTLLKCGANARHLDAVQEHVEPLQIDTDCNRSVQGTMNQMKGDFDHMLWYDNVNISELSASRAGVWLADRPCTVKGRKECIWPMKAMLSLLDGLVTGKQPTAKKAAAAPRSNVISLASRRGVKR